MRISALSLAVASLMLAACGAGDPASTTSGSSISAVASLPVTLEGELVADIAEGDVDGEGTSEFNFGSLTVNGEEIPVQVSGSVMQSAGLTGESSGKVRATISSKTDEYGSTIYTVSALQRL